MSCRKHNIEVIDFWGSLFGMRVRIALDERKIKFKYTEENLCNPRRSQAVLEMNPVKKSVPILIHEGKPVCESSVILEYIEETLANGFPSLVRMGILDRAVTSFWVDFINDKFFSTQVKFLKSTGDDTENQRNELVADLKQLEGVLGEKMYFNGDEFGLLDIAFIPFTSMFYGYEKHGNFKLDTEIPKITAWMKRCAVRESVFKNIPDCIEMYELYKTLYGIE